MSALVYKCNEPKSRGGINKAQLLELVGAAGIAVSSSATKEQLCAQLLQITDGDKLLAIAKKMDELGIRYSWKVEKVFENDTIQDEQGKTRVAVKWVGFEEKTYEPIENVTFGEPEKKRRRLRTKKEKKTDEIMKTAGLDDDSSEPRLIHMVTHGIMENFERDEIKRICESSKKIRSKCKSLGNKFWRRKLLEDFNLAQEMFPNVDFENMQGDLYFLRYLYSFQREVISAGSRHSLALLANGSVLGGGVDDDDQATGSQAALPEGRRYVSISAGDDYSLGLLDNGQVVGWGNDRYGRATGGAKALPNGRRYVAISAGDTLSVGLLDDGTVVTWGEVRGGGIPAWVKGHRFIAIDAGSTYALGLLDNGKVVGWGLNSYNQAKGGTSALPKGRRYVAISAGAHHSLGLLDNGKVVGWGEDYQKQATGADAALPEGRLYVAISAGHSYSLGLLDDGTVVGWGSEGLAGDILTGGQAELPEGRHYVAISAGFDYALGLLDNGVVVGWGLRRFLPGDASFSLWDAWIEVQQDDPNPTFEFLSEVPDYIRSQYDLLKQSTKNVRNITKTDVKNMLEQYKKVVA